MCTLLRNYLAWKYEILDQELVSYGSWRTWLHLVLRAQRLGFAAAAVQVSCICITWQLPMHAMRPATLRTPYTGMCVVSNLQM